MFGKRADGKVVKTKDPIFMIIPHVMKKRSDSQVFYTEELPIAPLDEYIAKKEAEGIPFTNPYNNPSTPAVTPNAIIDNESQTNISLTISLYVFIPRRSSPLEYSENNIYGLFLEFIWLNVFKAASLHFKSLSALL